MGLNCLKMNQSHAIQNNLKAEYCPQLFHADAMFHLTDEALSSNLLMRNAKWKIILGRCLDLR